MEQKINNMAKLVLKFKTPNEIELQVLPNIDFIKPMTSA